MSNAYTRVQELGYPEFCAALVRMAEVRFAGATGLEKRVQMLVVSHIVPLLEKRRPTPVQHLLATPEFALYLHTIRPILRLVYSRLASSVQVRAVC